MFSLHEKLEKDTAEICGLGLSRLLLMNDREIPWLILVPERKGVRDIHELSAADRAVLIEEIALAARLIETIHRPDKINIGALGNLVPQLHIHVIGRFAGDRAWPGPIWGKGPVVPYDVEGLKNAIASFRDRIGRNG